MPCPACCMSRVGFPRALRQGGAAASGGRARLAGGGPEAAGWRRRGGAAGAGGRQLVVGRRPARRGLPASGASCFCCCIHKPVYMRCGDCLTRATQRELLNDGSVHAIYSQDLSAHAGPDSVCGSATAFPSGAAAAIPAGDAASPVRLPTATLLLTVIVGLTT